MTKVLVTETMNEKKKKRKPIDNSIMEWSVLVATSLREVIPNGGSAEGSSRTNVCVGVSFRR